MPQGWYHKDGRKQERKRKARVLKQKVEKEKAKEYRAWVRRTRAEEKEKAKEKKKEQEKGKVLSCEKRFVGGGWCGGCGGWWLWWVLLASLPTVVEAAVPGACCLAGLWTFLPLGILAFMAPKRRPAAKKRPAARGEGAGGQQNPGESAGGAGEGGGATEAPKKRKKVEEEEEKEKEAEEGGQVAEEGAAARPTSIPNPTDVQPTSDYWIREGNMWKRVHVQPRKDLYVPQQTDDGPDLTRLVQGRRSIIRPMDGTRGHSVLDDWTTERQATFDKEWTGSTNFEEHPQLRSRREGNDVEEPPTHAHQSLWDLNRQEEEGDRLAAPLGQAWDVDFVSMEISGKLHSHPGRWLGSWWEAWSIPSFRLPFWFGNLMQPLHLEGC